MAKFNVEGIDLAMIGFAKRADLLDKAASISLKAGAEVLVTAQKASIEEKGLVETGDMMGSIRPTGVKTDKDGNPYVDIYPQGTDRKGVRNAEKGFINEYGTSKIAPKGWMSGANAKAHDEVQQTIYENFTEQMNKGGNT